MIHTIEDIKRLKEVINEQYLEIDKLRAQLGVAVEALKKIGFDYVGLGTSLYGPEVATLAREALAKIEEMK